MGFLLKWFALGWLLSVGASCLYVVLLSLRAQKQSAGQVVAVNASLGWLLAWTLIGACLVVLVALAARAWLVRPAV